MRLLFAGTPAAAVPTLEELAAKHEIALVVTQPDRPKGRSGAPVRPPVGEAGDKLGLAVAQPENASELAEAVSSAAPLDLGVVVAYGRLLRPEVLDVPRAGFLNAHFSLLPRWRGAAPVERALMAGDEMTGVTIIRLDEGLDTGPVLTAQAIDIEPWETGGELTMRLAGVGARLLASVVEPYLAGELVPMPQVEEGVTHAGKISAEDRPLDVGVSPHQFVDHVRALAPDPGATLEIDGERHKILSAAPSDHAPDPGSWQEIDGAPVVGVRGGGVVIVELQRPGRRPQAGADWLRGWRGSGGRAG